MNETEAIGLGLAIGTIIGFIILLIIDKISKLNENKVVLGLGE